MKIFSCVLLSLLGSGLARATDFDRGVDAKAAFLQAQAAAAGDASQPAGAVLAVPFESKEAPVMADSGDGFMLRSGEVWRVIDRYDGLFPSRIGRLDGAHDVASLVSFQDRLLAVQKSGRVFVLCATTGHNGVWAAIAVDMSGLEVKDSRLYAVDRAGRRYLYTGDLASETDLGLKSSLLNVWLAPSLMFGNGIHNFTEISSR